MDEPIGRRFQNETKYNRAAMPSGMRPAAPPSPVKTYPKAARVALGVPIASGGPPLWDAIARRRSVRRYARVPLSLADLSQLLWATQGVTGRMGGHALRAAPSAGALYPIETYLSVHDVEGVERGLYHYAVGDHVLERLPGGDPRDAVARAALDQDFLYWAPCVFLWTAVFGRSTWKYRERGYRYVYLDAAHIAQNLALACAGLGLGSCQVAALYDEEVNALLGVDGEGESILYMSSVGAPA